MREGARAIEVVPDAPVRQTLTYAVPPALGGRSLLGYRVLVPLGRRTVTGYVVGESRGPPREDLLLKEMLEVLDQEPALAPDMLELTRWMAEFYQSSWGRTIRTALPLGPNPSSYRRVKLVRREDPSEAADLTPAMKELLAVLAEGGPLPLAKLRRLTGRTSTASLVGELERRGWVETETRLARRGTRPSERRILELAVPAEHALERAAALERRAPRQAELLRGLARAPAGSLPPVPAWRTSMKGLIEKGLAREQRIPLRRDPASGIELDLSPAPTMTPDQQRSFEVVREAVLEGRHGVFLLHGVTGSGKTEVYLRLMEEVLRQGKQAICLVPEISLTPQAVARFRGRFGDRVGVLHSAMSRGEATDEWRRIRRGEAAIALGPRSALFAPVRQLGLVILDEEHDGSYKQDEEPHYHARSVAMMRARIHGAPVLLGSATPSLESYHAAEIGRIRLLTLPRRVLDRPLPPVEVVDMRVLATGGEGRLVSDPLDAALTEALSEQGQVLILYNRRGFATILICPACRELVLCPHCSISLVYHRSDGMVRCHYCAYQAAPPRRCPECSGEVVEFRGAGVQRLEEELRSRHPEARIARLDSDVAARRRVQKGILRDFGKGRIDILVGTQMIAKGHDYPGVVLVGVIGADMILGLPDFRSTERTFSLITQVAGRTGRGDRPGRVLVQALQPDHFSIRTAAVHDYQGFYRQELGLRRQLSLPPFSRLALLTVRSADRVPAWSAAQELRKRLGGAAGERSRVYGPGPAPVTKVRDEYRFQVLVKSRTAQGLQATLREALRGHQPPSRKVSIRIDVDPVSLW